MLIQFTLFILLIIFLFLLSQKIISIVYDTILIIGKNKKFAIGVLVVLLLPGTIIHELSHFVIATILRVPTGQLSVFPTIEENGEVKAGKLFLGESDPFRLSLIGLAPMIIGLAIIDLVGKFFFPSLTQPTTYNLQLTTILGFYLFFITSLTMFSSKKDLEGLIIAVPIISIILISLHFIGVRIFFDKSLITKLSAFLADLDYYLGITVVLNSLVFLTLYGNLYLWQKLLKRKLVRE